MCIETLVMAGASVVGGLMANQGRNQQQAGIQAQSEASNKAEAAREQQMNLEAERAKRDTIRRMMAARAEAVSSASNQGASFGSGIQGGIAGITGQGNASLNATQRAQDIGSQIFSANRDYANAQAQTAIGSGNFNLGMSLFGNATQLGKQVASAGGLFQGLNNSLFGTSSSYGANGWSNTIKTPGLFS